MVLFQVLSEVRQAADLICPEAWQGLAVLFGGYLSEDLGAVMN
jgi:hypothetical protein